MEQEENKNDFIYSYQALKTMCKVLRKFDIKATYPDQYRQILILMLQQTSLLVGLCNEDTIHIPLEILTFLSKVIPDKLSYLIN